MQAAVEAVRLAAEEQRNIDAASAAAALAQLQEEFARATEVTQHRTSRRHVLVSTCCLFIHCCYSIQMRESQLDDLNAQLQQKDVDAKAVAQQ